MATVPTYDNYQVGKASRPNTQVAAPTFQNSAAKQAQALGNATTGLSQEMSSIATQMQQEANLTRVKKAENDLVGFEHDAEYGENGFLNLRGENALFMPDKKSLQEHVGTAYDKHVADISKDLGNDHQKAMLKEIAMQRKTALLGRVDNHVLQEHRKYRLDVEKSTAELARNQMTLAPHDPEKLAEAHGAIVASVQNTAHILGWSPEQTQVELIKTLSPAHSSVIIASLDANNPHYAESYFKQHKGEMTMHAREQMKSSIHEGMVKEKSSILAASIIDKGGNDADMIAAARNTKDEEVRKKAVAEVKSRINERRTLEARTRSDADMEGWQAVANGGKVSIATLNAMNPKTKIALEKLAAQGGKVAVDDNRAIAQIESMTPEQFRNANLLEYSHLLTADTIAGYIKKQHKPIKDIIGNRTIINGMMKRMKLNDEGKGRVYKELHQWQVELGHTPSHDEVQKFSNFLESEVVTGNLFGIDTHTKVANLKAEGVPPEYTAMVAKLLSDSGIDASDENMKKQYDELVKNGLIKQ